MLIICWSYYDQTNFIHHVTSDNSRLFHSDWHGWSDGGRKGASPIQFVEKLEKYYSSWETHSKTRRPIFACFYDLNHQGNLKHFFAHPTRAIEDPSFGKFVCSFPHGNSLRYTGGWTEGCHWKINTGHNNE